MSRPAIDVAVKAISGNAVKHGTLKQSTQKNGVDFDINSDYVRPNAEAPSDIQTHLTNYFDDEQFYSC